LIIIFAFIVLFYLLALRMSTILLISPYWKEPHRWMVSSLKLAELWQRLGYKVIVVCMGTETKTERISDTLVIHFRRDKFFKDPWNYGVSFGFSGFVARLAKSEKPDLIVINKLLFWSTLSGIRLRLAGRRFILLTDALVGMTWWPRGWLPRLGARIYAWTLGWLLLCLADRVVFFHPQPPSLLRFLRIAQKSSVIPTGVDPAQHIQRIHHSDRRVSLTYVGRLESVKGVDDFLAAAVPLKAQHAELHIRVVGWHPHDHPLVEQYRHQVIFTGLRKDIPEILSETDIFVLPSHSEGLSNALMEAMASGCACIASDTGGNSFLVQNGVSGFLFPPGDRRALKAHLQRLLDDPAKRKAISEAAKKRIDQYFSWNVVGEEYRRLFESQMENGEWRMESTKSEKF
jgi:glycosyltransferase involved in cell wall biosynthesis